MFNIDETIKLVDRIMIFKNGSCFYQTFKHVDYFDELHGFDYLKDDVLFYWKGDVLI